jgi:hypothetical protein
MTDSPDSLLLSAAYYMGIRKGFILNFLHGSTISEKKRELLVTVVGGGKPSETFEECLIPRASRYVEVTSLGLLLCALSYFLGRPEYRSLYSFDVKRGLLLVRYGSFVVAYTFYGIDAYLGVLVFMLCFLEFGLSPTIRLGIRAFKRLREKDEKKFEDYPEETQRLMASVSGIQALQLQEPHVEKPPRMFDIMVVLNSITLTLLTFVVGYHMVTMNCNLNSESDNLDGANERVYYVGIIAALWVGCGFVKYEWLRGLLVLLIIPVTVVSTLRRYNQNLETIMLHSFFIFFLFTHGSCLILWDICSMKYFHTTMKAERPAGKVFHRVSLWDLQGSAEPDEDSLSKARPRVTQHVEFEQKRRQTLAQGVPVEEASRFDNMRPETSSGSQQSANICPDTSAEQVGSQI